MKILVTGGAGFIASHIVDAYIKEGHEVFVLDNLSSGNKANVNPKAHFIKLDIQDPQITEIISKFQPDIINHHAAQINVRTSIDNPKFDAQVNILGILNLLESIKTIDSVRRFILASTGGAIYGEADEIPTTETYPAWPISPYGIAKLTSEHYLYYYQQLYQLPFISLRYANVYGPRQNPHGEAGVVSIFYQKARDNQPFTLNGDGNQTRDFVFVGDVVKANLLATTSKETGIYNIGTSKETAIKDLVEKMTYTLDFDPDIQQGSAPKGEQGRSCLDPSLAKKELNWQPETSLEEGLAQTAKFFLG